MSGSYSHSKQQRNSSEAARCCKMTKLHPPDDRFKILLLYCNMQCDTATGGGHRLLWMSERVGGNELATSYTSVLGTVHSFFSSHLLSSTTLALPPSSNSDPGSHSGPSSPLPTTVPAFICYREKTQLFIVDSRRIVRTHAARRSQQFILFIMHYFCK